MYIITFWAPIQLEVEYLKFAKHLLRQGPEDDFVEYIDEDSSYQDALIEGYAHFDFVGDQLHVFTVYKSNRFLTFKELLELSDYTQGQWSDGIGEGFEQQPLYIDNKEVYVSMWYPNQPIFYKQEFQETYE